MLEHQKYVLDRVSYDKELFRKELLRSFKWLPSHEIFSLRKWVVDRYGSLHKDIISEIFKFRYKFH